MRKTSKKVDGINFVLLDEHFFYTSRIDMPLKNDYSDLSDDIIIYNNIIYRTILYSALIILVFGTVAFLCLYL